MTAEPADVGRHRRRSIIAGCAAVIVAAVVTVIVVVATVGGSDGNTADSPATTATAWGKAALFHRTSTLRALSCPSATDGFGVYGLVFNGTGVKAGRVTTEGTDTWDVPITTTGPGGGTTIHVKVERTGGKYLVC